MNNRSKGCARSSLIGAIAVVVLCLVAAGASYLVNQGQPQHSSAVDRLSAVDKSRLAEAFHLRGALGDKVLPGWAQGDIPVILYNEAALFLVGDPAPADGWQTVPSGKHLGSVWQPVPGDDFSGQPYFRQTLPAPGQNTQAFTVQVGDRWAASLTTLEWMRIALADDVRQNIPGPLQQVIPYSLMVNLLVPSSDAYVTLILHESVHAYQGMRAPDRLAAAEQSSSKSSKLYPSADSPFQAAWQTELNLLNQALKTSDPAETARLARAFLDQRAARRTAAKLSAAMIDFENQKEWEEGIAKYGELSIYKLAASSADYHPLPELSQDKEFQNYRGAQQKWDSEVDQITRMAGTDGDNRFYYSGFAQAVLLDRLAPGWKDHLFDPGVNLEDLLAAALPAH